MTGLLLDIITISLFVSIVLYVLKELLVDCKRMSQTKKLKLGKIMQLIDLNGDSTNFDISFTVTCEDDTPYNILVVDQTTLDNTPELQYKEVKNSMSGKIIADKNVYQNYFLILKSDTECFVDVDIKKHVLPITPNGPIDPKIEGTHHNTSNRERLKNTKSSSKFISWKKIGLIALVVIIGIGVLWWLYKRKVPDSSDNNHTLGVENFNMSPKPSSNLHHIPSPDVNISSKKTDPCHASPVQSSCDRRGYIPSRNTNLTHSFKHTSTSPDVMSQSSHMSSSRSDTGGNSLLNRLRKFAR